MRAKVEQVIEIIRPAIQADKGDIVLHDVNETTGLVMVELVGACVSCPASTVTLKAGVERILKDRVPGVTAVRDVNDVDITGAPNHPVDPEVDADPDPMVSPFDPGSAGQDRSATPAITETPVSL